MSLILNIYADTAGKATAEELHAFLETLPHVKDAGNGEYEYLNENTGVYFGIGNEPVDHLAKGFQSLEIAFIVNYGRAEFFGLEIFPVIERICSTLGLLVDNEQQGKPQRADSDRLLKEWRKVNDGFLSSLQIDSSEQAPPYMPRQASNALWRFLLHKDELQEKLTGQGHDVYVAQPLYFRNAADDVVTAVAWPSGIPIVLPPHTDYLYLMHEVKKRFFGKSSLQPLGYVSTEHVLEAAKGSFTKRPDGSLQLLPAAADAVRQEILNLKPDLSPGQDPGHPIAQDAIIDVRP